MSQMFRETDALSDDGRSPCDKPISVLHQHQHQQQQQQQESFARGRGMMSLIGCSACMNDFP